MSIKGREKELAAIRRQVWLEILDSQKEVLSRFFDIEIVESSEVMQIRSKKMVFVEMNNNATLTLHELDAWSYTDKMKLEKDVEQRLFAIPQSTIELKMNKKKILTRFSHSVENKIVKKHTSIIRKRIRELIHQKNEWLLRIEHKLGLPFLMAPAWINQHNKIVKYQGLYEYMNQSHPHALWLFHHFMSYIDKSGRAVPSWTKEGGQLYEWFKKRLFAFGLNKKGYHYLCKKGPIERTVWSVLLNEAMGLEAHKSLAGIRLDIGPHRVSASSGSARVLKNNIGIGYFKDDLSLQNNFYSIDELSSTRNIKLIFYLCNILSGCSLKYPIYTPQIILMEIGQFAALMRSRLPKSSPFHLTGALNNGKDYAEVPLSTLNHIVLKMLHYFDDNFKRPFSKKNLNIFEETPLSSMLLFVVDYPEQYQKNMSWSRLFEKSEDQKAIDLSRVLQKSNRTIPDKYIERLAAIERRFLLQSKKRNKMPKIWVRKRM